MDSHKLQVFDPPQCCPSGVCGPEVDREALRFARALDWLGRQGIDVERHNLAASPAAFAREKCVREALEEHGIECLPLIVLDGSVVSRGVYPSRDALAALVGLPLSAGAEPAADRASPMAANAPNAEPVCGPGCDCGAAPRGRAVKLVASAIALVLVVGALVYRGAHADRKASNGVAASEAASAFALPQADAAPEPVVVAPLSQGLGTESATQQGPTAPPDMSAAPSARPAIEEVASSKPGGGMGRSLGSLNDLNRVAARQDAVLIFIPGPKDEAPGEKTESAMRAARRSIEARSIAVGLYTLSTASPDYAAISRETQLPVVLVATKGRGMAAVSGEITQDKLLQAFVASASSSCGPSGCGPSGCG